MVFGGVCHAHRPRGGLLHGKNWGQIPIVFHPGLEPEYTVCWGDGLRIEGRVRVFQPAAAKAVAAILTILGCRVPSFGVWPCGAWGGTEK